MKLTQKLASMALVILPGVLFGRCPENDWQPVDGVWSGSWSDARHWSLGHEPTASERAYFPAVDQSFSVSIEGTHDIGELDLQGMDGDFRDLTFSGSGTVRVTKSDSAGCSSWFGTRRNLVLDGASLVWTAEADLMLSGHMEVRSGSSIVHKRIWQMRTVQAQIVVNGGTVSWNGALRYYETSTDSYLVVNSGTVYLAALSGADDANKSAYPFVMEVNGGEVTAGDFSLTRQNCALKVNGGKMTVNNTFKMNAGSGLYMTGGELDIKASESNVQVAQGVTISLFGGTVGFHYHFGDRRFLSNEGATVNLNGYRLLPDGVEPLKGETVKMGRIFNASPGAHLDYRRLVFQKKEEPFGVRDGTERYFYLQGPTTISAEDSMPGTCGMAWYAFCRGAFVVDTRDADDGETPLNINLLNVHPEYGECSFDVLGGGILFFRQAFSGDAFKSFAVRQNTTLQLADRKMDSTDYCALLTERLVLEKNATLKLNAKYNHVVAGEFDIDPGAKIEITVPDDLTVGAFAVLQNAGSIDSVPPIGLSQISLIQSEGRGFKLKAENGQVTVYHEGSVGEYPTEWTGLGPNDNINESANFKTQAPASRETVYFGAGSARLNPKWSYPLRDGGYVIGTMIFLETAVETFDYHASGETLAEERSFVSHSGVPQRHTGAKRTPAIVVQTDGSGPLVFDGEAQWGGNYHAGDTPDDPNHFRWTTAGDCRIAIPAFTMYDFALNPMLTGVTPFSRFTVLPGSSVTVTRMADDISASRAGIRVEAGGSLTFTDYNGNQHFRVGSPDVAKFVVNGTMDIQIPFLGGANQTYGGKGTLKLHQTVPSGAATRVRIADSLTLTLATNWETARAGADVPLALMVVGGDPTLKVSDGWHYGVTDGFASVTSPSDRSLDIASGATLTVDAQGGTAAIDETVTGAGSLLIAPGTVLRISGVGDSVMTVAKAGSVLNVSSSLSIGALSAESGATLLFGRDAVLTVNGDVSLSGVAFAFENSAPDQWQTVLAVRDGAIADVPPTSDKLKIRMVETEDGQAVQCKALRGMAMVVR